MRTSSLQDAPEKQSGDRDAAVVSVAGQAGIEQGILARDLMTELMGVVPVLGGFKVTVGFAGEMAFCDSRLAYVNIPALPEAKVIPLQIAREIRGFAAHEAAHIAFTDSDVFPAQITDDQGNYDKLLKEIWNCVEDYMIERHWLELYPGARKNFAATEIRCCRGYMDLYQKDPDAARDLRRVGPAALTWLRALEFGLGTQVSRECFETLPAALQNRVWGWFADIEDVETTQECLDASRRIHADIMADPFDPQNPPQNPQAGQQGQQAQQGQGGAGGQQGQQAQQGQGGAGGQQAGQGGGQGQQGGGQGQQGTQAAPGDAGQDPAQDSGQGGAQGGKSSAGGGTADANTGPDPISTSAKLDQVLTGADAISDDANMVSSEVLSSATSGPFADALADPAGYQAAQEAASAIQDTIAATSSQLRRALRAASRDRWKGGRLDGRMDDKRAAGAASGAVDFYKRKVRGEEIDTALSVLIDCSNSMNGTEIQICQQLALTLENALATTPINQEIVGFTTGDPSEADQAFQTMLAAHQNQNSDVEGRAVNVYEFRKFGQSHGSALLSIGNMTNIAMSGTPTSDAILFAHDRLARRPERRHVLFVLTDGAPDDDDRCAAAVQAVERCGVTVIGIGIGSDSVRNSFANSAVLSEARDLPVLMMSHLSSILIGDKRKKALKGAAAAQARGAA